MTSPQPLSARLVAKADRTVKTPLGPFIRTVLINPNGPEAVAEIERLEAKVKALEEERDEARHVVKQTLWMAQRYANGRMTYAVEMFNDAARLAVVGGYAPEGPMIAKDGMFDRCSALQTEGE